MKPVTCVASPIIHSKQIDVVNRLVHQGAAAVERLRSLPAALVVIRLRSPPLAGRLAERQAAEAPCVDGGLERRVRVVKPRREDGAELDLVLVARVDDAVAALGGDLQRLLDDDVLAGIRGRDGGLHVIAARRGDDDDVHIGPLQRFGYDREYRNRSDPRFGDQLLRHCLRSE